MDDSRRKRIRRAFSRLLGLVAVLFLLHGAAWAIASHSLARFWAAGTPDWHAEDHGLSWTGWPSHAGIAARDARLTVAGSLVPGGMNWRTERLDVTWSPLAPGRVTLAAGGRQQLRLAAVPPLDLDMQALQLIVPLQGQDSVLVDATGLRAAAHGLSIGGVHAVLGGPPDGGAGQVAPGHAVFDLTEIALPGLSAPAIEHLSGLLALRGTLAPAASAAAGAAAWRASGGALQAERLDLAWGPLTLGFTGKATLDASLQPRIEGTARVQGADAALDRAAAAGLLQPGAALAVRAVLGLLARPAEGQPIALPVSLEAGLLRVGRIPLLRLAPLAWP